jgi:Methyltransferase domain
MPTATRDQQGRSLMSKLLREVSRPFRRRQRGQRGAQTMPKSAEAIPAHDLAVFDPQRCTVEPEGLRLLVELVQESANFPGPIVEIGTLLGITATHMALAKQPGQKIITVDNYSWNPWQLPPNQHFALTQQVLYYLTQTGHVEQIRQDKNEFYSAYSGPAPALVFVDAMHDYEETKRDIQWAQRVGARLIAGHDYCARFPGVMRVVDEYGGPCRLGGSVWALRTQPAVERIKTAA